VALVVVGDSSLIAERGVIPLGRIDDETWASVLAGASAFSYPTRYEGFGMPAIEAIASGVPVVCAPVASLPEVLGNAAEWCPTPTVSDIAAGLERVLVDSGRHEELRSAGLSRAAQWPSIAECAAPIRAAYRFVQDHGS
jgi:alpha-1,3-rhamnosyl/mannosyltransferase